MGKDRRKKQPATASSEQSDSEPKGQRERRVRTQREIPKNTDATVKEKVVDNTPAVEEETKKGEPVNTEELFANLKRETDDIKALTSKRFAKRQIFSNWEKYEEPAPQPKYEVDIQGADFESLLQEPSSGGGHFQFKSERCWDANVSALSGELFSLDVDILADGLATIPLYKKLDVPVTLFLKDEMENMDCLARTALKQYETTKKNIKKTRDKKKDAQELTNRLLDIIKESSPAPTDNEPTEDKTLLNFDIDQPEIQQEFEENVTNDKLPAYEKAAIRHTPPPSTRGNESSHTLHKVPAEPIKEIQNDTLPSRDIMKGNLAARANNTLHKEIKSEDQEEVTPIRQSRRVTPPKEIKREHIMPVRETKKESTPPKEIERDRFTPIKEMEKQATPPKEIDIEHIKPIRETKKERTPPEEMKRERYTPVRETGKRSTPPKEIERKQISPMRDIREDTTHFKDITADLSEKVQHLEEVDSSENVVQEPAIPLGQRKSKRKAKVQSQTSEGQNKIHVSVRQDEINISETQNKTEVYESQNKAAPISESQKKRHATESQKKSQPPASHNKNRVTESKNNTEDMESRKKNQISDNHLNAQENKALPRSKQPEPQQADDDDLDFLLSLKKPVRESQLSGLQPSQVAKPSIEEDDADESDLVSLVSPQKQTEDLEDWLDCMLDD